MKWKIKFDVIGASENICKWRLMNFFVKLRFVARENINDFLKGNKNKGGNKNWKKNHHSDYIYFKNFIH